MTVSLHPFPSYHYPATGTVLDTLPVTREGVRVVPEGALTATAAPGFVELRITNKVTGQKSRAICGLVPATAFSDGRIRFHERTLTARLERQERAVRADGGALGKPVLLTTPAMAGFWGQERLRANEREYRLTFRGQDNDYDLYHLPSLSTEADGYTDAPLTLRPDGPLVIADGHHRAETHARLAAEGYAPCAMVPVCIIPGDELTIGTFIREIDDNQNRETILTALREYFTVTSLEQAQPPEQPGEWLLRLDDRAYRLVRRVGGESDLDSAWLDKVVLPRVFGIGDTRTAANITFAPASAPESRRPDSTIESAPDVSGRSRITLQGFPLPVADFFAEVAAGRVLPPKSTMFQPRIPSGLVVWGGC